MGDTAALLVALALLLGNAFFVGAEFSLVAARRTQLEPLAEQGSTRARTTVRAMRRVSVMMAGAQLGITLCTVGLGAVGEPAVAHLLEPAFHAVGLPDAVLHPVAFVLATLIIVSLHVVVGEMVPKNLALAGPERSALLLGPPLAGMVKVLRPAIVGLNSFANGVLRLLGVQPQDEVTSTASDEDVAEMVDEARREGLMDAEEYSRVSRSLQFSHACARDVMLARASVVDVPADATPSHVEAVAAETGHSRFPVRASDDGWRDYVHLKDVVDVDLQARGEPLRPEAVRALPGVAGDTPLLDVLAAMRDGSTHIMGVRAAGGRVDGLVLLDDVLLALLPRQVG
ncbi:MAG TPA: hemolysin family protein [Nocardioidaceae bacterium]|nr:hemolysin family protein [Nocardioidaceae bacterium]